MRKEKPTMAAVQKPKYEINIVGDSEIESVHHIGLSYDGNYYSVICGKYMNGGFCSIPNWELGANYPLILRTYSGMRNHYIRC